MLAAKKLLGDGDSLALAAGNLRGIELRALDHVQALQVLQYFFVGSVAVFFDLLRGQDQVAENRSIFKQRIILRDNTNHSGFDGSERGIDQHLSRGGLIQPRDNAKELGLANARGAEKAYDLALRAVGAHDVANLRVDIVKNDFIVVRQTDVVNLEKRIGVFALFGQALSSQMPKPLPLFQLQIRVGKEEFFGQAQRIVLKQANQQDGDLNRKDGFEAEMFVLIEKQRADAALGARNAFDHCEHHPSHRGVLAHGIESGAGPAQHDHFPNDPPLAHAQGAGQIKLFLRHLRHHVDHAGDKEDGDPEDEQAYFQAVPAGENDGEEKGESHHAEKSALGNRMGDRLEHRNNGQIGEA